MRKPSYEAASTGRAAMPAMSPATTTRVVDVVHGQMFRLRSVAGSRVEVVFGDIWLTEEGDTRDHFPRAGDEISLGSQRQIVVESLGPIARLLISEPVAGGAQRRVAAVERAERPERVSLPGVRGSLQPA